MKIDWRAVVRRHCKDAGVRLSDATIAELAEHLEDVYLAAVDEGHPPEAARRRADDVLRAASLATLESRARGRMDLVLPSRSFAAMTALQAAVRQFRHHRSFAVITVLVLGLAVGAATTVFTVVDSVVLRPLPYKAPDRLVTIWDTDAEKGLSHEPISPVTFMDQRDLPVFDDAAAWWRPGINLLDPGLDPARVNTIEVSGNLFDLLGVGPQVGAGFPVNGPLFVQNELIAVISDRLWRTRYSADPSVLGRPLLFNQNAYTIVGVMPPGFHFPDDVDVWQRLRWDLTQHSRAAHFMEAVAVLAPGTTLEQAQSAVETLGLRVAKESPDTNGGWNSRLIPLLDDQLGYYRPALIVLFGAVGLLLVIGVFNVASLLLTRALSREREIAVRMAMGASPRQVVTQLFAESLGLSAAGAAAGLLAATAALPLIVAFTPVEIPRLEEATISARALVVATGIVVATTLVFGLVPALLLLRGQITSPLRAGERGASRGARRIYSFLVAGEVALACALLVSSALLVRTVDGMMSTPTGVDADDVVTTTVQLPRRSAQGDELRAVWLGVVDTHARLLEAIERQPGVQRAGGTNFLPYGTGWRNPFGIVGQPLPARPEDAPQAQMHSVSHGYFEAMGARLAAGRFFTAFDRPESQAVVIVNEAFARQHLGGEAVGRTVRTWSGGIGPLGWNMKFEGRMTAEGLHAEVVGVVGDIRNVALGLPVEPAIYFPTSQFPFSEQFVVVRAVEPRAGIAAVQAALREVAPEIPMATAVTWGERAARRTAEPRLLMAVLTFFGALAAVLAAIGVYGLFSWIVAMRTRELAIRLTLGASPQGVGRLVVNQSALLVGLGLVVGWVIVQAADAALARVLFGVTPSDPGSTAVASALLAAAALAACVAPAIRAMRVDPVEGLRAE
ncbi:MAG: ABC transporter permease [Acidobacteriota bacterium]